MISAHLPNIPAGYLSRLYLFLAVGADKVFGCLFVHCLIFPYFRVFVNLAQASRLQTGQPWRIIVTGAGEY